MGPSVTKEGCHVLEKGGDHLRLCVLPDCTANPPEATRRKVGVALCGGGEVALCGDGEVVLMGDKPSRKPYNIPMSGH